jgi:hypothetical protein
MMSLAEGHPSFRDQSICYCGVGVAHKDIFHDSKSEFQVVVIIVDYSEVEDSVL